MPPKDKIEKNSELAITQNKSLKLKDISISTSVEDLLNSGIMPKAIDTKEKLMAVTQYGKELGMDPLTAINSVSIIAGKMVVASSMLGALLKKKGYEYIWTKDWDVEGEGPATRITTEIEIFWVSKALKREISQKFKMTWKELELAGLTESNPTYKKYPKAMLRARCISAAVRAVAPEILLGMYTVEELAEQDPNIELKVEENGEVSVVDVDFTEVK
jgi:hypothetical protein